MKYLFIIFRAFVWHFLIIFGLCFLLTKSHWMLRQTFFTDVKIIISVFECGYVIWDIDCETWMRFAGHIGSKNNLIAMHVPGTYFLGSRRRNCFCYNHWEKVHYSYESKLNECVNHLKVPVSVEIYQIWSSFTGGKPVDPLPDFRVLHP